MWELLFDFGVGRRVLFELFDFFEDLVRFFGWQREPFVGEGGFHGGEPGSGHVVYPLSICFHIELAE